jgi:hypothetical protein
MTTWQPQMSVEPQMSVQSQIEAQLKAQLESPYEHEAKSTPELTTVHPLKSWDNMLVATKDILSKVLHRELELLNYLNEDKLDKEKVDDLMFHRDFLGQMINTMHAMLHGYDYQDTFKIQKEQLDKLVDIHKFITSKETNGDLQIEDRMTHLVIMLNDLKKK